MGSNHLRPGALVLCCALSGCVFITRADIEARDVAPSETDVPLEPGNLLVQVLDPSGYPAQGVDVTLDGERIGVTDAAGWVSREDVLEGWHALGATGAGGVPTGGAVEVAAEQTRVARLTLARTREGVVHRPAVGGAIAREGEYAIVFDDGAFVDAPDAPITVSYAWVEPGSGAGPVPIGEGGAPVDLVAVAWIGDGSASGENYPVDPAGTGTLRIPAPPGGPIQQLQEPKVLRFDEVTATWLVVGPAEREDAYLSGDFEGKGWWALGTNGGSLGCLSGTLSSGADAAGALVTHTDPARPLPTVGWADADGAFCVPAPAGHPGRVEVSGATYALDGRFGGGADDAAPNRTAECGPDCTDLGELAVETFGDGDDDGFFGGPGGDCDDGSDGATPGLVDALGDGVDTNCDGVDGTDADHDGNPAGADSDCDDTDPERGFSLPEVCDAIDNDCDDRRDEDVPESVSLDGRCLTCGPQAIVDLGPKLYWHFGELGASTPDSSGYGFDATVVGVEESRNPIAQDGVPAPWFNGTQGQYVNLPSFSEMGRDAVTISMFIRPTLTRKALFSYSLPPEEWDEPDGTCSANSFNLKLAPPNPTTGQPGNVSLRIRDWSVQFDNAETLDAWAHLVITWRSDGRVQAYKNGIALPATELTTENMSEICPDPPDYIPPSTGTTTGGLPDYPAVEWHNEPGGAIVLGQDQDCAWPDLCLDGEQSFEGAIDEVAIFDRVLNEGEIEAIWQAVTCGEGFTCDDDDVDGDGLTSEHLVGSEPNRCAADSCEDIVAAEADMGDGLYWIAGQPAPTTCTFPEEGDCSCRVCGDGEVANLYESCEDALDPDCRGCAWDLGPFNTSCAEIQANEANPPDGIYWIYPDGLTSYKVRCNFSEDGGGWTLVVNQDTRAGNAFYDPVEDPPGELEEDHLTYYSSTAGLSDWRSARPTDPFFGAYSILNQLERFRGTCGFDFRMVWQFDAQSMAWTQTSNPTEPVPLEGYAAIRMPNLRVVPFRGLYRAYDIPGQADALVTSASGQQYAPALMIGAFDEALDIAWYPVAVYPPGVAQNLTWRLFASPDISPDGTVRGSELWVRPCTP